MPLSYLRLPAYYGDHMVLQQKIRSKLYGKTKPYEEVTLTLERFPAGRVLPDERERHYGVVFQENDRAEQDGFFEIKLPYIEGSKDHYRLTIKAGQELRVFNDCHFGEVFFAAGESNMAMPVVDSDVLPLLDAISACPGIRFFTQRESGLPEGEELYSPNPLSRIPGGHWVTATEKDEVLQLSAIAVAFAYHFYKAKDIPVAVYTVAANDSCIHSWLPRPLIEQDALLKNHIREIHHYRDLEHWNELPQEDGPEARLVRKDPYERDPMAAPPPFSRRNQPGALFNHKLAPYIGLAIRAVLWYQGESDVQYPDYYMKALTEFVSVLREVFTAPAGGLTFYYCQLAPYYWSSQDPCRLAAFNEALTAVRRNLALNAGMVTLYDLPLDYKRGVGPWCRPLNPSAKNQVAKRLLMLVRGLAYQEDFPVSAPECVSVELIGNKYMLTFDHVGKGIEVRNNEDSVKGFSVCGEDGIYVPAKAKTLYGVRCIVWHPEVTEPSSCAYGYQSFNQAANLCGSHGLPLVPFRLERSSNKHVKTYEFMDCDRLSSWQYPSREQRQHRFDRQDWPMYLPLWGIAEGRGRFVLEKEHRRQGTASLLLQYKKADEYPVSFGPILNYASLYPPLDLSPWNELRLHIFNADHRLKQLRLRIQDANGREFITHNLQLSDLLVWQEVPFVIRNMPIDLMRIVLLEFSLLDPLERGSLFIDALSLHGYRGI